MRFVFITSNLLLVFWCLASNLLSAQRVTSLYLKAEDFEKDQASFTAPYKIQVRSSWPKKLVKVKLKNETHYLHKDSVFAYKNKLGEFFRFQKGEAYQVITTRGKIQIYRLQISNAGKYEVAKFAYFFSRTINDVIHPLTIAHLLAEFADQGRFTELIELHFNSDQQLLEYDELHQQFKLNRLFELSQR